MPAFDPVATARAIADAHARRAAYENLSGALAPPSVADAYAAQEALVPLWAPAKGPVAGLKIATTTKVMQQLLGIDHPCGGMIYERTIHRSPFALRLADHMHVVVECELAVRLSRDLPAKALPYTRDEVRDAIGAVTAAFELIEDRNAVYKDSRALTLIADNAWNAGIVLGAEVPPPRGASLDRVQGRLAIDGRAAKEGLTDDPMGALAWVANLAVERRRPMRAGMVVITGSVIATLPISAGQRFEFTLDGVGSVAMTAA